MDARIVQLTHGAEEYIKEIAELWSDNAAETADCELDEEEKTAVQEQIKQYMQSKYGAVFAATNEKHQAVGYAIASLKQDLVSNTLYGQIDEIYVAPEYRRQKMAGKIAAELLNWLERKNVSFVQVYVDTDNESALAFWEETGLEREFFVLSKY
ncbi:GNAT family N-acetyltransferase [Bacillus glycinifermentans]|uniref:Acetyltransferase n=1 Tax=Bacillus glycinifermentans TaxID=1664069 RepID=A0A0T6BPY2_9BACI|nr:GNAT family N-acetyltransferase [Bacillus glycinifermentans]ATH94572.1 N-acetyltransferase [Bacillus glycinifermentans]KRT93691.1 acetyltransferase [Bacillus glycinifermentans]MEC0486150.1 GNAT family N-acetyltransferase [Bacillus glycinifermentans]MEC3608737.1 GNAT family N-acetyltransferase [Bacillus glycinifermentans]